MEQKLKLPAQCALIPPEEQQLVSGGAPAWMTDFVTDVKDTLRPYKPYFQFAWHLREGSPPHLRLYQDHDPLPERDQELHQSIAVVK